MNCFLRLLLIGFTGMLLILSAQTNLYADEEQTWQKVFDVKPGGLLSLESDIGSVDIVGTTSDKVEVEVVAIVDAHSREKARKILDDFTLDFEQDSNSVSVFGKYKRQRSSFWGSVSNNIRVEFNISVPSQYDIDIYTAGGSIVISDLSGKVTVETSGGSLHFDGIKGTIHGNTSGGSITLRDCSGDCDVETSGGHIDITGVLGQVVANTSGGGINIEEVSGMIDASTSGGGISARIVGQPKDDCRLETSGGGIVVYLNKDISVDINAETSAGHVESDFPVTTRGKIHRSSLHGRINAGGPELYLHTSAGNIEIIEI